MTRAPALGLLVLRLALGLVLILHAYVGYANLGPRGVAPLVSRAGVPSDIVSPVAWSVFVVHTVGGILVGVGLWTRTAALLNVPIVAAAMVAPHWPHGFSMRALGADGAGSKATAIGYEFSLLVLACTVAVTLIGAGPLSLDGLRSAPSRRR